MFFEVLREGDGKVWPLPSANRPGRWTNIADPRVYDRHDLSRIPQYLPSSPQVID